MGCWNKTCGLSSLHITSGTPVYVFMLEQNDVDNDRCYSTALWRPTLLSFLSQYNDYGGGENSHENIKYIIDGLKKNLVELDVGKNQYHDIAVKADAMNEDLLFEAVHEGRLFVNRSGKKTLVDFTMIRKDVVDHICETWVQELYVGAGKGTSGHDNSYIEYKYSDIIELLPAFIDSLMCCENSFDVYHKFDPLDYNNLLSRYIGGHKGYQYGKIVHIAEIVQQLVIDDRRDAIESVLHNYLLGCFIDEFMQNCRKIWIPGCHEGSQSMEHEPYRVLNSAISNVLDAEKAEFDDEYDDSIDADAVYNEFKD